MMKTLKNRNISSSLASNKTLKAMLGEEEDNIDQETDFDMDGDTYDGDDAKTEATIDTTKEDFDLGDSADEVYSEGESDDGDDWEAEEDDLLILKVIKHKPKLSKGEYLARVGTVAAEKMRGKDGSNWVKVTLPFEIKTPDGVVTVPFIASMSLSPKSRFYPVIKGILGHEPEAGLSLRELQGTQVKVQIDHHIDDQGSVWEEVKRVKRVG